MGKWTPIIGDEPYQLKRDEVVIKFSDSYSIIVDFRDKHKKYSGDHNACKTDIRLIEGRCKDNDLIVRKWCLVKVSDCESNNGRKNETQERQTA